LLDIGESHTVDAGRVPAPVARDPSERGGRYHHGSLQGESRSESGQITANTNIFAFRVA
jgi:hypothetical protein